MFPVRLRLQRPFFLSLPLVLPLSLLVQLLYWLQRFRKNQLPPFLHLRSALMRTSSRAHRLSPARFRSPSRPSSAARGERHKHLELGLKGTQRESFFQMTDWTPSKEVWATHSPVSFSSDLVQKCCLQRKLEFQVPVNSPFQRGNTRVVQEHTLRQLKQEYGTTFCVTQC